MLSSQIGNGPISASARVWDKVALKIFQEQTILSSKISKLPIVPVNGHEKCFTLKTQRSPHLLMALRKWCVHGSACTRTRHSAYVLNLMHSKSDWYSHVADGSQEPNDKEHGPFPHRHLLHFPLNFLLHFTYRTVNYTCVFCQTVKGQGM